MLKSLNLSPCVGLESLTFRVNSWRTNNRYLDDELLLELTAAMSSITSILQTAPSTLHLSIGIQSLHLQKMEIRVWFWERIKEALQPFRNLQTLTIMLFADRTVASKFNDPNTWWTGSVVLPPSPSHLITVNEVTGLFPNIRVQIVTCTWD